jgi:hypothetical protein
MGYNQELEDIYRGWLRDNFPRFQDGKYDMSLPEEEDTIYRYVDYQTREPAKPVLNANKWKGAYRSFGKVKDKLKILGIEFDDIPQAIDTINNEKERIAQEIENIAQQLPIKLQEFTLAKEERMIIQPTIQQRVDEFAEMNPILHEIVPVLPMDKAKAVEIPTEKLPIKPSKKDIEKEIQEAVIQEEVQEEIVDTTDLISNLQNGLVVRFNFGTKKGKTEVVDIFYDDEEYITYTAYENSKGEIISDEESTFTEKQVIDFYIEHFDKISEEFYDDGTGEEEVTTAETEVEEVSKAQMYQDLIEGYELALELESDEEKIQMYNDLIEGYQLALELEN